jgi:DNA-binding MarR family transcriptional regulator
LHPRNRRAAGGLFAVSELGMLGLRIGRILVTERPRKFCGFEIARRVGVNRGSAHRVLRQFAEEGWVEQRSTTNEKKAVKVIYEITRSGVDALSAALGPFQLVPMST